MSHVLQFVFHLAFNLSIFQVHKRDPNLKNSGQQKRVNRRAVHFMELNPQDAWLPITESRNGNAYYAAFHTLCSGTGNWLHRPWVVSKYLVHKFGIAYLIKGSQELSKSKPFQNKLSEEVFYIIMV